MVFDSGCRKIVEEIVIGKDKDTRGTIMIAAEESLWSTEVPHLSLPFSNVPPFQSIMRASSCSLSVMFTVEHVMVALALACFHRFI